MANAAISRLPHELDGWVRRGGDNGYYIRVAALRLKDKKDGFCWAPEVESFR